MYIPSSSYNVIVSRRQILIPVSAPDPVPLFWSGDARLVYAVYCTTRTFLSISQRGVSNNQCMTIVRENDPSASDL